MELRHFRYFVAVAEELHFRRAAERLNIAQPALSVRIRQMEDDLGGRLFHRAHRGVTLTEAGRLFLDEARETLARAAHAEDVVRRAARGELGQIGIGYSATAALSGLLAKAARAIQETCPHLQVKAYEMDPQSQLEGLAQRQIHLSLTTTLGLDIPGELAVTRLAEWPLRVVLPKSHALADLEEVPVERLQSEAFIVYSGSPNDDGLTVVRSVAGFSPKLGQRAASAVIVVALVGAGLGVALLPSALEGIGEREGVVFRSIGAHSAVMDCSLIHRKAEHEPAVRLAQVAVRKALLLV